MSGLHQRTKRTNAPRPPPASDSVTRPLNQKRRHASPHPKIYFFLTIITNNNIIKTSCLQSLSDVILKSSFDKNHPQLCPKHLLASTVLAALAELSSAMRMYPPRHTFHFPTGPGALANTFYWQRRARRRQGRRSQRSLHRASLCCKSISQSSVATSCSRG